MPWPMGIYSCNVRSLTHLMVKHYHKCDTRTNKTQAKPAAWRQLFMTQRRILLISQGFAKYFH